MSSNITQSTNPVGNPVIPLYAADPHADLFGDRYYIYATNAGIYASNAAFPDKVAGEQHGFAAWSSLDMKNWKSEGRILNFEEIEWAADLGDAWAPCMAERNGRYYFYFCATSRMGVAVGDSPTGPFHDALGTPLVDFRDDISAIDPMVFIDDDGQAYFYWGAVPGGWLEGRGFEIRTHLSVRLLNADMISFGSEEMTTITTAKSPGGWHSLDHIEATHVFKRNGIYYLMWSQGGFATNNDAESYRVNYATSDSPLGPWKQAENNPVLSTRREVGVVGPGHHSTLQLPGTDIWYCVYHCHKGDADRRVFIDRMTFDENGGIEKIVPTLEGPPPCPVKAALSTSSQGPYNQDQTIPFDILFAQGEGSDCQKVEFFSGQNKIGETDGGVLSFDWKGATPGFHRVFARCILASGDTLTTAWLNIDVL
jgi:beta-xylosidase